ncbi:MAG: DNA repair ATPase [Planctomycetota bacterium]
MTLARGTYEIIRDRLATHAEELRARLQQLNADRREVFGAIETRLLSSTRITTDNKCVARDMISIGDRVLLGYNVHVGLRQEIRLEDVFAVRALSEDPTHLVRQGLELIGDPQFLADFRQLYRFYKKSRFAKFFVRGPHLYMVFHTGTDAKDMKAFKWLIVQEPEQATRLRYIDNRSEHEVRYPAQHGFEWKTPPREWHRDGAHPHISIEDRLFVETVGGDLTIKIEDNTDTGQGIYAEPVLDADQTLDDAEILYAIVGSIILLKVRPYREADDRYLAYSEKTQRAIRLDALQDACVLLPEQQGLIFSDGYYLQNGETKTFENGLRDLVFERRVAAPNGEDSLYVFYNRESGTYALLVYNLIEQRVETPIVCQGYCLLEDGRLFFFKSAAEPQRQHTLQVWQTSLVREESAPPVQGDSFLWKVGNQELVRGMAECHEVATLAVREDSYADLYVDLIKKSDDLLDNHFWLGEDAAGALAVPLREIGSAARAAVEEFDRVVRIRQATAQQVGQVTERLASAVRDQRANPCAQLEHFVRSLTEFRTLRGEIASLRELRYVPVDQVDALEQEAAEQQTQLAHATVEFLLGGEALQPYEARVEAHHEAVPHVDRVAEGQSLEQAVDTTAHELELLVDVVSHLEIEDATQRTEIIEKISAVFAYLHQARAALRARIKELSSVESEAEFHSQVKLLEQGMANYLDLCETPDRCDEYLTKLLMQIEDLEGRFAEFDELVVQLADKRTEVCSAFDGKKTAMLEARSRRAAHWVQAAERILTGIANRINAMEEVEQIHSFFAADPLVAKVRHIVTQLDELGEAVKVDDLQSRLKMVREEAIRQLRDRRELFVDGGNLIQLGDHQFSVNTQSLDLTTIIQQDTLCFHLTGTNYSEPITVAGVAECRDLWERTTVAENREVYRAEFLAHQLLVSLPVDLRRGQDVDADLLSFVQKAIAARPSEGYVKGVHDRDAVAILSALIQLQSGLGALTTAPQARALALLADFAWQQDQATAPLRLRFANQGRADRTFTNAAGGQTAAVPARPGQEAPDALVARMATLTSCDSYAEEAVQHLLRAWYRAEPVSVDARAVELAQRLHAALAERGVQDDLSQAMAQATVAGQRWAHAQAWVDAYASAESLDVGAGTLQEVAAIVAAGSECYRSTDAHGPTLELSGMLGEHARIKSGHYRLDYHEFMSRLDNHQRTDVPRYERFQALKHELIERRKTTLCLDDFRPRVLTSFVRNRLIDQVYLPLIGDNLAKQMGVAGEQKRTDRMGLLMLISPPGYGKTTLMEYTANRLGLTFVKINGPAIGHQVTSLDPSEAPHASARSEIEKLNLALEMGDNVMIYVDDIQHCHPEFLQKFISLCDAQRKMEGVFNGVSRTYDLRGRKVAVVMAGNPYTESGARFVVPDMLANRADTYNLGDVIEGAESAFELSYLENAVTSNEVLRQVVQRHAADIHAVIALATLREGAAAPELTGNYSSSEIGEFVTVMQKLIRVRDVVLKVNHEYIRSAAQADAYRAEPAFKLQGSYRDMNKLAERIVPVMNEAELETAILSHYENQAQTLTTGAEASLLKLKEILGCQTAAEATRWEEIKTTFARNQWLGAGGDDRLAQIVAQMDAVTMGLNSIGDAVRKSAEQMIERPLDSAPPATMSSTQIEVALSHLARFADTLEEIQASIRVSDLETTPVQQVEVVNRVPRVFMEVIRAQFALMQAWASPRSDENGAEPSYATLRKRLSDACQRYERIVRKGEKAAATSEAPRQLEPTADAEANGDVYPSETSEESE